MREAQPMLLNSPTIRAVPSTGRIKFSNLFALSGPSGVGKTSAIRGILDKYKEQVVFPLTYTTREKRAGEVHGRDMYFVSRAEWCSRLSEYFATTEYGGHLYGTKTSDIRDPMAGGKKVLLALDYEGVQCLRAANLRAVEILLMPRSVGDLARFLKIRWPDKGPQYESRVFQAIRDMSRPWTPDYIIESVSVPQIVSDLEELMCLPT